MGMKIQMAHPDMAEAFVNYYVDNEAHLKPWEPRKVTDFYRVDNWRERLASRQQEMADGEAFYLLGFDEIAGEIVALCSLTGISRGALRACHIGYSASERYQGKGYMTELARYAVHFAFNTLELHRVMAAYMPNNERSARLLKRLQFQREGFAKSYLKINGRWEDHVLMSRINSVL